MLFLIGLGLDTNDISVKALDMIRNADSVMFDSYTNIIPMDYIALIEKEAGKKIIELRRADLEDNIVSTISQAKEKNVAMLVSGDPMIATTHSIIINKAIELGIAYTIVHSSSILSAGFGESGLSPYRFGQTTTIPFWSENYKPVSFLDTVKKNLDIGAHTLLLLDYDGMERKGMDLKMAITLLEEAERQRGYGIVKKGRKIIVMSNLGKRDQAIIFKDISEINLEDLNEFSGKILTLAIPSKLSFAEEESASRFLRENNP